MALPRRQFRKLVLSLRFTAAALLALAVAGWFWLQQQKSPAEQLQAQAEDYVRLGLSLAAHDPKAVDAWFGPEALDVRGDKPRPLAELEAEAQVLLDAVLSDAVAHPSERRQRLAGKLRRLVALLQVMQQPKFLTFEEEARRVYDITLGGSLSAQDREAVKQQLEALLPGSGSIAFRVASFRSQFIVPADRRERVFQRALEECRARTVKHWKLPQNEHLQVEWTRQVDAAWHRYEGNGRSLLQLNPLALAFIGSMIDVACHEAYPGHHAQFLVLEAEAGEQGLTVEEQLVLLRSPESVLREGAAHYGVELAFPPEERLAFERDVLFPLAGLPAERAETYVQVHRHIGELALSVMPILRQYYDGELSFNSATYELEREALISSPQALLRFVDELGAYVSGYTVARDHLRHWLQSAESGREPWEALRQLLSEMQLEALKPPPVSPPTASATLLCSRAAFSLWVPSAFVGGVLRSAACPPFATYAVSRVLNGGISMRFFT